MNQVLNHSAFNDPDTPARFAVGTSSSTRDRSHDSQFLASLVQASDDSIVSLDGQGIITSWNPSAEKLFGWTAQEAIGNHVTLILPVERHHEFEFITKRIASGGFHKSLETQRLHKEGKLIDVSVTVSAIRDTMGELVGYSGIYRDITDLKRAEQEARASTEALSESEERHRMLVDCIPQMVWMTCPAGNCNYLSPQGVRYVGIPAEELFGWGWLNLLHPEDVERTKETWQCAVRNTGPYRCEYRVRQANGEYRWFLAQGTPLLDDQGGVERWVGSWTDIHDRKIDEVTKTKLVLDLQLRDRAIQAATQGVVITDPNLPDNPIIYVSPGFERITGYSAEEVLGKNCRMLQGEETDPDSLNEIRQAIAEKRHCTVELLNYRKDGTTFWNSISIAPVTDADGNLVNYVGVQTDVTEKRHLEERCRQSQKMEAVGQLAGGIAHDFNNMLTIISGYTEMLLDKCLPGDPARDSLEEIKKASDRSAALTRQLLTFSRKQVITPYVLDLNEVVHGTEKMLRYVIGEDILFQTVLATNLNAVKTDPGEMEQILVNLAVNARDAMPQGGKLSITTSNVEVHRESGHLDARARTGDYVLLSITDTGTGMEEHVKKRLFEPFFTTKEPGQGTGLGLAAVHGVVEQSEGFIEVESEAGKGTTIKIYLPAVKEYYALGISDTSA